MNSKVYIAIPISNPPTVDCELAHWLIVTTIKHQREIDFTLDISYGRPLERNGNHIIKRFLESDATHLLWIDNDIIMDDPDFVPRILSYDKDIVGGNVLIHRPEFTGPMGCAAKKIGKDQYQYQAVLKHAKEPLEVDVVGFGCIMIKREVIEKMKKPWLIRGFNNMGEVTKAMDVRFCEKAKELGFKVWLDAYEVIGQRNYLDLKEELEKIDLIVNRSVTKTLERVEWAKNFQPESSSTEKE